MHVHFLGLLDRRHHPLEPTHRPQADIEVECLAQRHIERTDTAPHRSGQRSLDADQIFTESLHRGLGQPFACLPERFSTRQHFLPLNGPLAAIGYLDSPVHYLLAYRGDFSPYAISLDKRDGHPVGHHQPFSLHIHFTHCLVILKVTTYYLLPLNVLSAEPARNHWICMSLYVWAASSSSVVPSS